MTVWQLLLKVVIGKRRRRNVVLANFVKISTLNIAKEPILPNPVIGLLNANNLITKLASRELLL